MEKRAQQDNISSKFQHKELLCFIQKFDENLVQAKKMDKTFEMMTANREYEILEHQINH